VEPVQWKWVFEGVLLLVDVDMTRGSEEEEKVPRSASVEEYLDLDCDLEC
jgi:hypothetical protein